MEQENKAKKLKTGRPVVVIVGASSKHGRADVEEKGDSSNKVEDGNDGSSSRRSTRWGLGGALGLPFARAGYVIVLLGRRIDALHDVMNLILEEVETAMILCETCDVTDDASVKRAFDEVKRMIKISFDGYIDLVIFNAAAPYPKNFRFAHWGDVLLPHQIDIANMNHQYDTQTNGLIRVSKQVLPDMMERKRGCILVSGETICSLHGRYEFGSVAPPRAALRSLTQCMFQAYAPMGVHVCHVNIGGIIDTPKTRSWSVRDPLVDPHAIAQEYYNVYKQHHTVWSYEVQLTPSFAARKIDMRM